MKCSICIPVYNNSYYTDKCLNDLSKLSSDYEIIIVDNASTDNTLEIINKYQNLESGPDVVSISSPINRGFGGALNLAFNASVGEYIIFLNNDIIVQKDFASWPEIMMEVASDDNIVCTQGGLLDSKFEFVAEGPRLARTKFWYASGWCLCAKKAVFKKLELKHYRDDESGEIIYPKEGTKILSCIWDERFYPAYFEDVDLSWRARDLGINFEEVEIPVKHIGRVTGQKMGLSHMYRTSKRVFKKIWNK